MGRFGQRIHQDYTQSTINIDTICDVLTTTQHNAGVTPTLEIAYLNETTGEKFRRFQRRSPEDEEAYEQAKASGNRPSFLPDEEENEPVKKKSHSQESGKGKRLSRFKTGTFDVIVEGEDEEDDLYVCEYCSALGYRRKYIPTICDSCDKCLDGCRQYRDGSCEGCSFSRHRDGVPYSEKLSEDELLSSDDLQKLNHVQCDNCMGERKSFNHTVMFTNK